MLLDKERALTGRLFILSHPFSLARVRGLCYKWRRSCNASMRSASRSRAATSHVGESTLTRCTVTSGCSAAFRSKWGENPLGERRTTGLRAGAGVSCRRAECGPRYKRERYAYKIKCGRFRWLKAVCFCNRFPTNGPLRYWLDLF